MNVWPVCVGVVHARLFVEKMINTLMTAKLVPLTLLSLNT